MTALEAATARQIVPGLNAFGNWNWAQRLMRELNATGTGAYVTKTTLPTGGGPSTGQTLVAVVLAPAS